jgi:hypothetical protein
VTGRTLSARLRLRREGESVSEFLVQSGRESAQMILADCTQFVLDPKAAPGFDMPWPAAIRLLGKVGFTFDWALGGRHACVPGEEESVR